MEGIGGWLSAYLFGSVPLAFFYAAGLAVVLLVGALSTDEARLREAGVTLAAIVAISIAWAVVWTIYFLNSDRVARTFGT